jgi:hypothetical protein
MLATRLILFRLLPFILLESCNHSNLICFHLSNSFEHPSSNNYICLNLLESSLLLNTVFIFSLIVSRALLISSSSSSKLSRAANPFQISTRYCWLPSTSFNFLKLNLSIRKFCVVCLQSFSLSLNLPTPGGNQYHSPLLWMIRYQYCLQSNNMWSICSLKAKSNYRLSIPSCPITLSLKLVSVLSVVLSFLRRALPCICRLGIFLTCVCWSAPIIWCWDSTLCWVWTLPLCWKYQDEILFPMLLWQVGQLRLLELLI